MPKNKLLFTVYIFNYYVHCTGGCTSKAVGCMKVGWHAAIRESQECQNIILINICLWAKTALPDEGLALQSHSIQVKLNTGNNNQ